MKPTEELIHEHTVISHMLSGAERLAHSIQSTRRVDIKKTDYIVDFSKHFTDRCHHAKEEKHLFVRLQERGMPKGQGPIAVMLHEHSLGRSLIKDIDTAIKEYKAGNLEAVDVIEKTMMQYVGLLRAHIAKENNILFPLSDRILTSNDQQELEKSFKEIEENEIGAGDHKKYHEMAHEIGD